MQNNDKVALFDFCETIVSFQTADAYVRYVQSHSKPTNTGVRIIYNTLNQLRVLGVVRRLFPKGSIDKRFILRQMKGRGQKEMLDLAKDYYVQCIKPNFIEPILLELNRLQSEGYSCYIVSGGYDVYLKLFCEEYKLDGLFCTTIGFKNGVCTGAFVGKDCMFEHKIDYLKSLINDDCKKWIAFSDSKTDLPMLEMVGTPIVVSKQRSQGWAEKRNFKQLIWSNSK